jgi:hypothetical protein
MFSCFYIFIFDQFVLGKVLKLGRCHKGLNLKEKNIKKKKIETKNINQVVTRSLQRQSDQATI